MTADNPALRETRPAPNDVYARTPRDKGDCAACGMPVIVAIGEVYCAKGDSVWHKRCATTKPETRPEAQPPNPDDVRGVVLRALQFVPDHSFPSALRQSLIDNLIALITPAVAQRGASVAPPPTQLAKIQDAIGHHWDDDTCSAGWLARKIDAIINERASVAEQPTPQPDIESECREALQGDKMFRQYADWQLEAVVKLIKKRERALKSGAGR